MVTLIGISGFIGAGKDTVADTLVAEYGFTKIAFADTLKDVLSVVFGWDRAMLNGDTPESRAWRNEVEQWWSSRLGISDFTPRLAMQMVGTDLFRSMFNPDIWVRALERKLIAHAGSRVVVPDCRFFNELEVIAERGGTCLRVRKGSEPSWMALAQEANTAFNISLRKTAIHELANLGIHPSEYSWVGYEFASVLDNNSGIPELAEATRRLVDHLDATLVQPE